jgi:hypothetical protein
LNNPDVVFSQPKLQGEWAEFCFIAQAVAHRLRVSKPCGDSSPYDVIVDFNGRLSRVQVKSVAFKRKRRNAYQVIVRRGSKTGLPYCSADVDFITVLVIPESVWYIIPIKEVTAKGIYLSPHRRSSRRFEPFREAWHLLRGK